MKKYIYISALFFIGNISLAVAGYGQSYEIYQGDTINRIDANNLKQGLWKIFNRTKNLPGYEPDQIVEEGAFKDSRKIGVWKRFFPNGNIQDEIEYSNNRPNGYYKTYFENGQVQEEGIWKNNRNIGTFKRFYENGQVSQEFNFNESGKRDGNQKYYYDNGQLMIEGDWSAGKESGIVKEYYENGEIKAEKNFEGGVLDPEKTKTYEPKKPIKEKVEPKTPIANVTVEKNEKPNPSVSSKFNGDGYAKLFNLNKQVSKDGIFKSYKLMDGKWFKYDENGILIRIEIYKDGRYIGDGVIDEK
ncbi:MAG: toxin-antitoxin system YwqK family antitoxin [Flavobacteriales bacterium]|nr:toxin-antitoxin system YwqK family antitoxin [Flavobacteriales bacterium]